jgi:sarcosine oxidase subunit gamma
MLELEPRSALDASEHRIVDLYMRESALRVLGLRLIRSQSAGTLEAKLAVALPTSPNTALGLGEGWIVCTEPGAWRVYAPAAQHRTLVQAFADLPATEGLASDLSSRFCTFELVGPAARRAIASGCPLDLRPTAFETGRAAGSLMLGVPIWILKTSGAPSFLLSCERPHAAVVWDWLVEAASHVDLPI